MKHPAFDTIPRTLLFFSIFILAGAMIPLCLAGLIAVKTSILMIQGVISGLLVCGLSVLLWFVTRFTKLTGDTIIQGVFNHLALLLLILLVWLGSENLLFYLILPEETYQSLTSLIPFKIVIGILVFVIIIQQYNKQNTDSSLDEEMETKLAPDSPITLTKRTVQEKITVRSGSNIHIIPVSDLLYLQAEGDYVILYTASARYIKEETMKHLEAGLPSSFIRIHRSCIVNTNVISRIELYEKQHYQITLKTGHQLRASVSGYKLLKENLQL